MPRLVLALTLVPILALLASPAAAATPPRSARVVTISPAPPGPGQTPAAGASSATAPGPGRAGGAAPARSAAPHPVPIISLSVRDADLVEVVRSLARIAGVNLIVDPGVSGKVTAELVNVRWDVALATILKTQGLAMELDGRLLTVAAPQRLF
jgi:hypothetical protein